MITSLSAKGFTKTANGQIPNANIELIINGELAADSVFINIVEQYEVNYEELEKFINNSN